jgi:hypothetical protein
MRLAALLLLGLLLICGACAPKEMAEPVSSRSYKGHANDIDANNLVAAYPSLVGTRLDDCQTCHAGRMKEGKPAGSACDNCHDLLLHGGEGDPRESLNGFGADYLAAGRSKEALEAIKAKDSDEDGHSNHEELLVQRYPGSALSKPGQTLAPMITVSLEGLRAMPSHNQFMLVNTTQQKSDDYVTYKGVKIKDLFDALGISLEGATGITVIAPDGYLKSLPVEYVTRLFPEPLFYAGLDERTLGPDCGFVTYADSLPDGFSDGSPIPGEHWLMLGYERDGLPLESARLDAVESKMRGNGPLRMVVPQENPGKPDRGSKYSPTDCGDGLDFNEEADRNAGAMVRGVIAIRIDPMPAGVEEFDYMNGGWAYIDAGELIVYGNGIR